ncbi:hypothetical protein L596_016656 [Steinernema carpocapsae]|nr:hypothetical protein L596_016656 [Steinernema carpocapsae]
MACIPVKVCIRVRPLSAKELNQGDKEQLECYNRDQIAVAGRFFTFDRVFGNTSSQDDVYDTCASPLVDNLFKGFHCTILAYGQTGSGKTFTMGTEETTDSVGAPTRGIIPRMVETIFTKIASTEDPSLFNVVASMFEIYDEKVFDLLGHERGESLPIRESSRGVYVQGLSQTSVESLTETMKLLETGCSLRKKGGTAMNEQSSRSHAVFTVVIQKAEESESPSFEAKLHLVDLAGSERLKKTMAEGERKKEGIRINEGLLALGNVISALSEGLKHIPYRNSSITRILQDSLGGNSYTVMIACVSPAESNQEETLSTLRYADRTKKIKNKPVVNIDSNAAALKQLQEENRALKKEILRLKSGGAFVADTDEEADVDDIESAELVAAERRILELEEMCQRSLSENALLVAKLVKIEHHGEDQDESLEINDEMDAEDRQQSMEDCARNVHKINGDVDRLKEMIEERKKEFEDASHQNEKDSARFIESREEIRKLNSEIGKLTEEKDSLMRKLKEVTNTGKVSNQYRQRLKELEKEQSALKQKLREYARYESQKKESDKQLAKARSELESAKKMRVDMVKKLRAESTKFMKMKNALDRATVQIQRAERKREIEVAASKRQHERQMHVLKQKLAESQAASKRLQKQFAKQVKTSRSNLDKNRLPDYCSSELDQAINMWEVTEHIKKQMELKKNLERRRDRSHVDDEELEAIVAEIKAREVEIQRFEQWRSEQPCKPAERWIPCSSSEMCATALQSLFELAEKARIDAIQKNQKLLGVKEELRETKKDLQAAQRELELEKRRAAMEDVLDHKRRSRLMSRPPGMLNTMEVIPGDGEEDEEEDDKNDERFPTPKECRNDKYRSRHVIKRAFMLDTSEDAENDKPKDNWDGGILGDPLHKMPKVKFPEL